MILGLTGGIGCGKSTAARHFVEHHGFLNLNSDQILREEVMPSSEVQDLIRAHFGTTIYNPDGCLNRMALAAIIFENDHEREWLESILHPRLFAIWRKRLGERPEANWIVEVPLLFEAGLENWFDFTITVGASRSTQIARLIGRGMTETLAAQRITKQLPLALKLDRADYVLWNDGGVHHLCKQIDALILRISEMAQFA